MPHKSPTGRLNPRRVVKKTTKTIVRKRPAARTKRGASSLGKSRAKFRLK